jgi:methyl-accepting chemotaxis protein
MWHGIIKNRCKNGDHSWVDALIIPIVENDAIVGYLSVRRQARRADIEAAERHYQALRAGTARDARPRRFRLDRFLSIRTGVTLGIVFVMLMMLIGAAIGLGTIERAERTLAAMHREKLEAGNALGRIQYLMADNRAQIVLASLPGQGNPKSAARGQAIKRHLDATEANRREIDRLWQELRQRIMPGTATRLAESYWAARLRYVEEGLLRAGQALARGDHAAAGRIVARKLNPLYAEVNRHAGALAAHLLADSAEQIAAERTLHATVRHVVMLGMVGTFLVLAVSGLLFFRGIVTPVEARIRDLERMAQGRIDAHVDVEGGGEIGSLNRAFAAAQAKLQYLLDNSFRGATEVSAESARLKLLVRGIGDGIEDQHERVSRVLDRVKECGSGFAAASARIDELLALAEQSAQAPAGAATDAARWASSAQALVGGLRILALSGEEMEREMERIADFLVEDREAMHAMWGAASQLTQTAAALEKAAGWFEVG